MCSVVIGSTGSVVEPRGAVRGVGVGGWVRTILRARQWGGAPRVRNVISTKGNTKALHFSPAPDGP